MASWLRRGTWTPPCFSANHEGFHVDDRMLAEECSHLLRAHVLGGGSVIKFSADRVKVVDTISVNERKADAATRRGSCGADLLSKTDKNRSLQKNSSGSGFVTNLQGNIVLPLRNGS